MDSFFKPFQEGFRDKYSEGREDYTRAFYSGRELKGQDPEGTRMQTMLGTNPTLTSLRDTASEIPGLSKVPVLGSMLTSDPIMRGKREEMGMGLSKEPLRKTGQLLGVLANDLTQDHTRSIYWLLNAAQATGNVINEQVLASVNPDLYAREDTGIKMPSMADGKPKVYRNQEMTQRNRQDYEAAVASDLISKEGTLRKGVNRGSGGNLMKRKIAPGDLMALGIAPGFAINAGMGLMTPFGGYEGYQAVLPSEDDPSKSSNVLGEIALKYIMGRTGNLLPYEEFKKVRPDVSRGEYNAYKAFKFDKEGDIDISDGDVTLPGGALKFTSDGIHGAELQFLGRSLPVNTALVPFASSVAGGALGAASYGGTDKRPIRRGLAGSVGGLAVGTVVGNLLEQERRRRNTVENELNNPSNL